MTARSMHRSTERYSDRPTDADKRHREKRHRDTETPRHSSWLRLHGMSLAEPDSKRPPADARDRDDAMRGVR